MVLGRSIIPPEGFFKKSLPKTAQAPKHFLGKSAQKRAYAPKHFFKKSLPKTRLHAKIVDIENIIRKKGRKLRIIRVKQKALDFFDIMLFV